MHIRSTIACLGLLAVLGPAAVQPRHSQAASASSIRFDATISGKIHDSGSLASAEALQQAHPPVFNGCAIIKHKHTELGQYTLEVRINSGSFLLGGWQKGALDFSIADYKPNVGTYKSPHFGGKFAVKGHIYGASVTYSTVTVSNGGRSGTYTDQHAYNLVPGTANAFTSAGTLTFRASWQCSSVFQLSDS